MTNPYHASAYIRALTGNGRTPCTWQTFADAPTCSEPARLMHGSLGEVHRELHRLNEAGCGVFVTVNATDLLGRRAFNVKRIRALFVEFDGNTPGAFHLPPSIVVQSKAGLHVYWTIDDGDDVAAFKPAQLRLIQHYQSDPVIHDLPRVLRVPGYYHCKAAPFMVEMLEASGARYTLAQVLDGLAPLPVVAPPPPRPPRDPRLASRVDWSAVSAVWRDAGMYRRPLGGNKHAVVCPWESGHTSPDFTSEHNTSTVLWDANGTEPATFKCSHATCQGRTLVAALRELGALRPEART